MVSWIECIFLDRVCKRATFCHYFISTLYRTQSKFLKFQILQSCHRKYCYILLQPLQAYVNQSKACVINKRTVWMIGEEYGDVCWQLKLNTWTQIWRVQSHDTSFHGLQYSKFAQMCTGSKLVKFWKLKIPAIFLDVLQNDTSLNQSFPLTCLFTYSVTDALIRSHVRIIYTNWQIH